MVKKLKEKSKKTKKPSLAEPKKKISKKGAKKPMIREVLNSLSDPVKLADEPAVDFGIQPEDQAASIEIVTEDKSNELSKKSLHLINLKNPNSEISSDNQNFTQSRVISEFKPAPVNAVPTPPRLIPKNRREGVNFIFGQNYLEQLDSLIKSIFFPLIKLTALIFKKNEIKPSSDFGKLSDASEEIEDIFAPPSHIEYAKLTIPRDWYKKMGAFVLIAIILILPLQAFTYYQSLADTKDKVLIMTHEAINSLKLGQQAIANFDLTTANAQFAEAKVNFTSAEQQVNNLNNLSGDILQLLPSQGKSVSAGLALVQAGQIVAETGQILISGGQKFLNSTSLDSYYKSIIDFRSGLKIAINNFNEAEAKIQTISAGDLPAENRQTFNNVLGYLPTIGQGLTNLYDINDSLLKILGERQWQRYLVVFLNNNELRGGGGFMGSFAIVDVDQGKIKKIEIPSGGTYDLQGYLGPKVISPQPIWLINPRWEFQDANWWPDFATTAKKVEWFYQNSNGPSVDGVIMLTSTVMEQLLEIYGPIAMPEYGRDISSQNFVAETQKIVEVEYDKKENRPKQFIADLAPKLLDKVFNSSGKDMQKLLTLLKNDLNEKQLLVYFNDANTENIVSEFGWAGEMKQTEGDYLSVVHTNLAGGKTDGVIDETIQHQAQVTEDGSIIDTVKLIRHHNGINGENIFTGVQNNSYVRFYVPAGSTLLSATGFSRPADKYFKAPNPEYQLDSDLISVETDKTKDDKTGTDIYKESGKTVFGNWLQLKPGQTGEATIKYRLPFKLALAGQNNFFYSLLAQKQAGSRGSQLQSNLILNGQLKPLAEFPADLVSDNSGVSFNAKLTTDQFYGVALINN